MRLAHFLVHALAVSVAAFFPSRCGAGAGATAERKQKELEEAVAKAADAPNADLTKLQCGNLVYAGDQKFDLFRRQIPRRCRQNRRTSTSAKTSSRCGSMRTTLFDFPFCVWSGEEDFSLTKKERDNLRKYLLNGGFILSSPGCSDPKWDTALRRELKLIFPEHKLVKLPMSHPVFSTVNRDRAADRQAGQAGLHRRHGDQRAARHGLFQGRAQRRVATPRAAAAAAAT